MAMVSENFAREYWGSPQNALGKHIRVSTKDDWREIVGVIGDVHDDGMSKDAPTIAYWPTCFLTSRAACSMSGALLCSPFALRDAGSESLMKDVRQAVWSVDANLPLTDIHTQDYYYQKSISRTSFTLVMLAIAAAIALLLGIVGLYGVIAYSASQRTREIGIRIALGAQRNSITAMFVRQGLVLAGRRHRVRIAAGLRGDPVSEVIALPCQSRGSDSRTCWRVSLCAGRPHWPATFRRGGQQR